MASNESGILDTQACDNVTYSSKDVSRYTATKIAVYCVMMLFSLFGNALIVATFCRNRTMRTTVNCFILNMAVSDLLIPVFVIPWRISVTYTDNLWLVPGTLGDILCKLVHAAQGVSAVVSTLSMVIIAAERFYAILYAMKPALITRKPCICLIAAIWVVAVAFRCHYFYGYKVIFKRNKGLACEFYRGISSDTIETLKRGFSILLCLNILSTLVLVVFYSTIIVTLNRQQKLCHMASEDARERTKDNRKVTLMLVTIVLVFVAVWLPYYVNASLYFFAPLVKRPDAFRWIANNLPMLYTNINPVIYYTFNEKYRKCFKELLVYIFFCNRASRNTNDASSSEPIPLQE